jgi:predicted RNase H-like nuclease (RuvC/YqgF family)
MFDSLLEAAQESKWMPPEYMVNDWVADCRHLLIDGPFDPEPLRKELSAAGRNNYLLQESMQQLVDYADRLNKYIDYLAADFEIDLNSDEMRKRPTAPKANAELKLQKRITELEDEVKTLERELRDAEIDNTRLEQSLRGDY